jgi:cytochrome bd-type quinol oxidase subunit 1
MNISRTIPAIAVSVTLALVSLSSQAASATGSQVSEDQLAKVSAGEAATQVTAQLGSPENVTKWMDGTRSMVYELKDPYESSKLAYVDLTPEGKVAEVQVVDRY